MALIERLQAETSPSMTIKLAGSVVSEMVYA
jgi:hypothetical protein